MEFKTRDVRETEYFSDLPAVDPVEKEKALQFFKDFFSRPLGEVIERTDIHSQQKAIVEAVQNGDISLESTLEKGNFGEMLVDCIMEELGYKRISLDQVESLDASSHEGIDGVYYKKDGQPPYIVLDAKFNTAQLADTLDGKQMSESWIDARLDAAVGKETADNIRMAALDGDVGRYVVRVAKDGDVTAPAIFEKLDTDGNAIGKGDKPYDT